MEGLQQQIYETCTANLAINSCLLCMYTTTAKFDHSMFCISLHIPLIGIIMIMMLDQHRQTVAYKVHL